MTTQEQSIQSRLFALQDLGYRDFQAKLMPTVDKERIIGVRTPLVKKLARELKDTPEAEAFLSALPHEYYDENNLHGFLIDGMRDFDRAMAAVEAFLPCVDNWATCDQLNPRVFKKRPEELYQRILVWLQSERVYTVRFGVDMLMGHFLDDRFHPEMLQLAAKADREGEYYINMVVAWYFATALAKHYGETLPAIEGRLLHKWTHNKAIQKAVESYRITEEQKAYLKSLKIK